MERVHIGRQLLAFGLAVLIHPLVANAAWQTASQLPTPRVQLGAAAIGATLYVAGGYRNGAYVGTFEAWNTTSNTWSTLLPLPTARARVATAAVGNTIYVIGGTDSLSTYATTEAYDTLNGNWQQKASLGEPRSGAAIAVFNGAIYVFGGQGGGAWLSTAERYDPGSNRWTQIASMPTARDYARAVVIGSKIHVTGGRKGLSTIDGLAVTEIYDPATNQWQTGPSLPGARFGHAAASIGDTHYVAGGSDGSNNSTNNSIKVLGSTLALGVGGTSWTTREESLAQQRWGTAGVAIGNAFYVVGGYDTDAQGYTAAVEKLDLASTGGGGTGDGTRLTISASELAGMIPLPVIFGTPPSTFRDSDPLGISGASLHNAQASFKGDTLRIDNIVINDGSYWIDFRYDPASGRFSAGGLSAGTAPPLNRSDLPGIVTTSPPARAILGGPPFAADIGPITVAGSALGVGLLFAPDNLSFSIRDTRTLHPGYVSLLSSAANRSHSTDPVDTYIAQQGLVDTHLKSGADWNSAALSCATKLIGTLELGSVGTKALQMMATDGPEVFQGMREALLLGNPEDATLVFSQFAWKALAQNVSTDNELAAVFNKIADKAGYTQALSQGAGACTVDYKQGLQALLQGAMSTAFPISACAAELAYEGLKEARTALNDSKLQQLYQQWKALGQDGDEVFDYPYVRGDDGLYGTLVREKYGSEYDQYLQNPERYFALIAQDLKMRFRQWQAAEAAGATTRTRLQALKARFDALGSFKDDIRTLLPEGADDTQVFKRYVELMQRFRARLAPFMPNTLNATTLDSYAESVLYAYLEPSGGQSRQVAWQAAVSAQIRSWHPELFNSEPEVCGSSTTSWSNSWSKVLDDYYGDIRGTVSLSVSVRGSGASLREPTVVTSGYGIGVKFTIPRPPAGQTHNYTVSGDINGLTHPTYEVRQQGVPRFDDSNSSSMNFSVTSDGLITGLGTGRLWVWSEFWGSSTTTGEKFLAAETSVDALSVQFVLE